MKLIIKAIAKNVGSNLAMNLSLMGVIKLIAINLGPYGVGLFSIIRQMIGTFSSLGLGAQGGVILGVSFHKGIKKSNFILVSLVYFIAIAIAMSLILQLFANNFSQLIFNNSKDYVGIIKLTSLPVTLTIIYIYMRSIVNGLGLIDRLAILESVGPLSLLFLFAILFYGSFRNQKISYAVLFILIISLSLVLANLYAFWTLKNNNVIIRLNSLKQFSLGYERKFFIKTAGITIITGLVSAFSIFFSKLLIVSKVGLAEAGIFDAAWTLSNTYPLLLLGVFGSYFLPTLASHNKNVLQIKLINNMLRISFLFITPLICLILILKPLLMSVFFSQKFIASVHIFKWLLIADFFKVSSWAFSNVLIAKKKMKIFFWSELLWYLGFLLWVNTALLFTSNLEFLTAGIVVLYFISNLNYLYWVNCIFKTNFLNKNLFLWFTSLLSIVIFSSLSWRLLDFSFWQLIFFILFLVGYFKFFISNEEMQYINNKFNGILNR